MATDIRSTKATREILGSGSGSLNSTQSVREVLHGGIGSANLNVTKVVREVLRSGVGVTGNLISAQTTREILGSGSGSLNSTQSVREVLMGTLDIISDTGDSFITILW